MQLTAAQARRIHVAVQGLDRRTRRRARKQDVLAAIRRMKILQIDTISVVARSPYLVLFSRLGNYDAGWLDALLAEGALFEYWAHEASFLPIEDYALVRHRMLEPELMGWKYRAEWVSKNPEQVAKVIAHVRTHGTVRSADFERTDGESGSWWGWKPEKRALEALFTAGELMVARRQSFQRVYDLRERVHASWSDDTLPSKQEVERRIILESVKALGVTTARWVCDYYRISKRGTPERVRELAVAGELVEANVAGWNDVAYIHPDNIDLAAAPPKPTLTTLLSPFDPLVWDRARALAMFNFDYRIECYTPAPKRQWGYYVLPILRRGEIVGRLDAKAHRSEGIFEVRDFYLEEGVRESDALFTDIAGALHDAAQWHGTPVVRITRTQPRALRKRLQSTVNGMPS